uniref:Peptide-N(4)-(N-acetyl-beta-glucosaminyl)asparagine amidase n=1 Tax=Phallusia mammillata TaxID=59560 RepID=A0A6F9DMG0_9ASCI|nr:peptide-N(4)-(N-acetyl-beta-glucosaminyl)asparagine amidase-like [Phallusia mammillata]
MSSDAVKILKTNSDVDFNMGSKTLIRIASNILKSPTEVKFRSIRIDSKAFTEKILPFDGAVQCLMEMGFQEDNDRFTLAMTNNLADLREILRQLQEAFETQNKKVSPEVMISQKNIYQRIVSHFQHSFIYENKSLQRKEKALVPFDKLTARAHTKMTHKQKPDTANFQHFLLLEVLSWFKRDFFKWMDKPICPNCNNDSNVENTGMASPSDEDMIWQASRVEAYVCRKCGKSLRFPRYNHPEKLLETRKGRCGEWANCFTLICRSLDFEARHVMDWTDHVWTEVFINKWDRWVHCDPCENACDTPLVYEKGWKKKLSLVVAANANQVIDVTMRYTVDPKSVTQRQMTMFDRKWLDEQIDLLNASAVSSMPPQRLKELRRRLEVEKQELSSEKRVSGEYGGRTSGSIAWRLARGETSKDGAGPSSAPVLKSSAIEPTEAELTKGIVKLRYFSHTNEYTRSSNNDETIYDWQSLVFISQGIQLKEELDWKMSYLCRTGDSDRSVVMWRVQLPLGVHFTEGRVKVESTTFESGKVAWLASSDKKTQVVEPGKAENVTSVCCGSRVFSITASLSGGEGDCAWQKSQLFRENTETPLTRPSFVLDLRFAKKSYF